jgi:hypothetical protein
VAVSHATASARPNTDTIARRCMVALLRMDRTMAGLVAQVRADRHD